MKCHHIHLSVEDDVVSDDDLTIAEEYLGEFLNDWHDDGNNTVPMLIAMASFIADVCDEASDQPIH